MSVKDDSRNTGAMHTSPRTPSAAPSTPRGLEPPRAGSLYRIEVFSSGTRRWMDMSLQDLAKGITGDDRAAKAHLELLDVAMSNAERLGKDNSDAAIRIARISDSVVHLPLGGTLAKRATATPASAEATIAQARGALGSRARSAMSLRRTKDWLTILETISAQEKEAATVGQDDAKSGRQDNSKPFTAMR